MFLFAILKPAFPNFAHHSHAINFTILDGSFIMEHWKRKNQYLGFWDAGIWAFIECPCELRFKVQKMGKNMNIYLQCKFFKIILYQIIYYDNRTQLRINMVPNHWNCMKLNFLGSKPFLYHNLLSVCSAYL